MKRTNLIPLVIVVLTISFVGYFTAIVSAQNAAATVPRPYQVAVVDIAQLIKNHPTFIAKQKELEEYTKNKQNEFNTRKLAIQDREKTLNALKLTPGTQEHDKAIEEITTKVTELEKDFKIVQRKLMTDNTVVLYEVYMDIRKEIDAIAKQAQLAQVMDYRSLEANPADPNSVAALLEQNLIWYADNLEISQAVINNVYTRRNLKANIPNIKVLREQEKAKSLEAANKNTTPSATTNSVLNPNSAINSAGNTPQTGFTRPQ
ncbi:MAG: OmpH family outer membrane protein [Planctomycetaceae bacterium]|nr:OmpH family outer membrane protein [Planctomycetaceae bacterium]